MQRVGGEDDGERKCEVHGNEGNSTAHRSTFRSSFLIITHIIATPQVVCLP